MLNINIIDFLLHVDEYIALFINNYGPITYIILFLIIFLETGLVITPFLPGDSLIFVSGAFSAQEALNPWLLFIVLTTAAIIGDSINYTIGKYFGERVIRRIRFIKEEHIEKTKNFYKKHGGKTIIYARFIPIIRTFAPFVAGIGRMDYKRFLTFNITGGILWVALFLIAGYYFGTIKFVQENLEWIIYLIIFLSIIPPIIEWLKSRMSR